MSHAIAANYPQIKMDNVKISPHVFLIVRSYSNIRHFAKVENTLISLGSHYFKPILSAKQNFRSDGESH